MEDRDLDALFATARHEAPIVSAGLMARVMADADAAQPPVAQPKPVVKPGFWAGFLAGIGGVPALAGLSTAVMAGLWLGFAQPSALSTVTDALLTSSTIDASSTIDSSVAIDVVPAFDDFLIEG